MILEHHRATRPADLVSILTDAKATTHRMGQLVARIEAQRARQYRKQRKGVAKVRIWLALVMDMIFIAKVRYLFHLAVALLAIAALLHIPS